MKKHLLIVLMLTLSMLLMTGCECKHETWNEADCLNPRTCAECGIPDGEPLGHDWTEATCEEPATCKRCGETKGNARGHQWGTATCETPKTCTICGKTEGEANGHVWLDATCATPKVCAICGKLEGEPNNEHTWIDATCEVPKTCKICGATEGDPLGHDWQEATINLPALCSRCGAIGSSALSYPCAGSGNVRTNESGSVPLYETPDVNSTQLLNIPCGTLLKCYNPGIYGWYCVSYGGKTGYIQTVVMSQLVNTDTNDTSHASSDRGFDIKTISGAGIGSKVKMGMYTQASSFMSDKSTALEWVVLTKTPTKMLLLADRSIEAKQFSDNKNTNTWESSSLRKWLNNEFYNTVFSSNEQRYIATTTCENPANPNGGTAGPATMDKVFLLSYDEFFSYVHKTNYATTTITWFGYWHRNKIFSGLDSSWWLRTTGRNDGTACEVGTNGYPVSTYCTNVTEYRDVRPAIWVNLN